MSSVRRLAIASSAVVLSLSVLACAPAADQSISASVVPWAALTPGSPTLAPLPSPSLPASSAADCSAGQVLRQVRELMAGQDFEAHYLTIGDKFTISVWLVDPAIDPATGPSGMAAGGREAIARGLSLSYAVVNQIPCTRRVFDQVNPMIVDARFQHWYKDFLPVEAFVGLHDPTTDDLIAAIEASGTALEVPRSIPPVSASASAGSCSWPEPRAAIHSYLGQEENTAAYLIVGAQLVNQPSVSASAVVMPMLDDVGVEVQWPVHGRSDFTDTAIRERLSRVAASLACMSPAIDSLEAFVVDDRGRTVVYAVVPGAAIRSRLSPLPPDRVRIYHMPVSHP